MASMWSLDGLPLSVVLKRTVKESWENEVFGVSARLAFYFFRASFPGLLLILAVLARLGGTGSALRQSVGESLSYFLSARAAELVAGAIRDLDTSLQERGILLVAGIGSALWAGFNASWTMIVGLNKAYEVKEDREWWRIALVAAGLALALLALVIAALLAARFAPGRFAVLRARWAGGRLFAVFFRLRGSRSS